MRSTLPKWDHERLRAARRLAGVRREDICSQLGISYDTIRRYEAGTSVPPVTYACALADIVGVSLDSLLARRAS